MLASMSLLGYKQCKIIEFSVRKTIQWCNSLMPHADTADMLRVTCTIHVMQQLVLHPVYDLPSYISKERWDIIIQLLILNLVRGLLRSTSWCRCGSDMVRKSSQNPPIKTLPKHPDPTILASTSDLGYKSHEVHEALLNSVHVPHAETAVRLEG
jgi:hypothetical protein